MANVALIARLGINCIFAIATANGATFSRLTVKDKRAVSFNIIAKWAAICPLEIYRCKQQLFELQIPQPQPTGGGMYQKRNFS